MFPNIIVSILLEVRTPKISRSILDLRVSELHILKPRILPGNILSIRPLIEIPSRLCRGMNALRQTNPAPGGGLRPLPLQAPNALPIIAGLLLFSSFLPLRQLLLRRPGLLLLLGSHVLSMRLGPPANTLGEVPSEVTRIWAHHIETELKQRCIILRTGCPSVPRPAEPGGLTNIITHSRLPRGEGWIKRISIGH